MSRLFETAASLHGSFGQTELLSEVDCSFFAGSDLGLSSGIKPLPARISVKSTILFNLFHYLAGSLHIAAVRQICFHQGCAKQK